MPKTPRSALDRTDPHVPVPSDTHVGPAPDAPDDEVFEEEEVYEDDPPASTPNKVHLRPSAAAPPPGNAEKTVVAGIPLAEPPAGAEATVISNNPLASRQAPSRLRGKLVVIEGKEKGRIIELTDGSIVFGRSKDCEVSLLDIQISRRHIEVRAGHNGVMVEDLGSGNGTLVNGEPIDTVNLVHGDEIALGDHVLRFEEEGPVADALPALAKRRGAPTGMVPAARGHANLPPVDVVRRARRRRTQGEGNGGKKKLVLIGGAAVVILGGIVVALAMQPDPPPPEPAGPTPEELAQRSFATGMQKFREASYDEALALFEETVAKMPEHREGGRYVTATRREIAARDAMSRGTALLNQKDYEGARQAFRQVASDSLRAQEAQQALRRADETEVRDIVLEGESLLESDHLDDAEAVFRRALTVVQDHEPARRGIERVEQRRQQMSQMTAAQQAAARAAAARGVASAAAQAQREVREALSAGERLFDQGDFQRAVDTFVELGQGGNPQVAGPAREKADAVRSFRPAYERGMAAAENRTTEPAITSLTIAERHARTVSSNGRIHQEVRSRLSDMHNLEARIAFNARRYSIAYQNWSDALKVNQNHGPSRQGMNDLLRIGEELYLEAYMTRALNRDESVRKFRQVMQMTPPGSDPHTKSRDRLAELER